MRQDVWKCFFCGAAMLLAVLGSHRDGKSHSKNRGKYFNSAGGGSGQEGFTKREKRGF